MVTQDIAVVVAGEGAYLAWCRDQEVRPYGGRTRRIREPFDLMGMPTGTWVVEESFPHHWDETTHAQYEAMKEALDAPAAAQADPA